MDEYLILIKSGTDTYWSAHTIRAKSEYAAEKAAVKIIKEKQLVGRIAVVKVTRWLKSDQSVNVTRIEEE